MLCHYWYFKDVGFKSEPHVCNKCHDVLMTAYELKIIAILTVKGVDYRCILWGVSKNEAARSCLKKVHLEELILETLFLVLMEIGTESHGEYMMS